MDSNSKSEPIARSEAELARQFADEYAGKVRCRFDADGRWHWERLEAGGWCRFDFNRLLAVVADFGAARFHATGPDGAPYPAPDRGGRAATARGVLNLAAWRLAADDLGGGPLHRAADNCDTEALRMLLGAGADVNAQDKAGSTPLHRAARNGDVAVIRVLLEAGAEVNAQDHDGSPLYHAVFRGDVAATRMLLEAGADPSDGALIIDNAWRRCTGELRVHRIYGEDVDFYGADEMSEVEEMLDEACRRWTGKGLRRRVDWDED